MSDRQWRASLLASSDAAAALDVSAATLRDWVRRGILTNHGTRHRALYDAAELVAAMDSAKPRRASDTPPSTQTA